MENRWSEIELTYTEPTEAYYAQEMEKIDQCLTDFFEIACIDNNLIKVNVKAIREIIKRIDMRQLYFKIYHKGMQINEYKLVVGLAVFWLVKLHPFWLDIDPDTQDDNLLDVATKINEKIALHMVIALLNEYNSNFVQNGEDLFRAYCDELVYSFRYRDLSKESLFLMFDPFYYLYFLNSSIDEDGNMTL